MLLSILPFDKSIKSFVILFNGFVIFLLIIAITRTNKRMPITPTNNEILKFRFASSITTSIGTEIAIDHGVSVKATLTGAYE